jgi:hypothetical protein
MRRSLSLCGYRGQASLMKCARSIGGECLANDYDGPRGREAAFGHGCASLEIASGAITLQLFTKPEYWRLVLLNSPN